MLLLQYVLPRATYASLKQSYKEAKLSVLGNSSSAAAAGTEQQSTSSTSMGGGASKLEGGEEDWEGYDKNGVLQDAESFLRDKGGDVGKVGLYNQGNTCFMNSALQCLSHTASLTDYFLENHHLNEINKTNPLGTKGELAIAFGKLLRELWSSSSVVRPRAFKAAIGSHAPQFSGYEQHDSQELLAFLLDGLHEDLNRCSKKPYVEDIDYDGTGGKDELIAMQSWANYLRRNKSIIVDLFQGQLRNTLRCCTCGHTSVKFDPFMYLSLPVPKGEGKRISVQSCLAKFQEEERLTGDNMWYCSKCKEHREATKRIVLWKAPPLMIIHLKRFSFDMYGRCARKRKCTVRFPAENLDLAETLGSKQSVAPLYNLFAVSNHFGGFGSGHYTAFCQHRFDGSWYHYDDRSCEPVAVEQVTRNANAYVLFYARCNDEAEVTSAAAAAGSEKAAAGESVGDKGIAKVAAQTGEAEREDLPKPPKLSRNSSGSSGAGGKTVIRRQSLTLPQLWPHRMSMIPDEDLKRLLKEMEKVHEETES